MAKKKRASLKVGKAATSKSRAVFRGKGCLDTVFRAAGCPFRVFRGKAVPVFRTKGCYVVFRASGACVTVTPRRVKKSRKKKK